MRATAVVVTFAIMVTAYGDLTPPPPSRRPAVVWGEGAKAATLRLRAEVEVKGEVVRVTDVAVLEGTEEAKARIGEILVGPSPLSGDARMISAGYVKLRLRKAGIGAEEVRVEGEWVKVKGANGDLTHLPPSPRGGEGGKATAGAAAMVKRGEAVEVWVRAGGVCVKTAGRAIGDGLAGDAIGVRIEQTQATVSGVVVAKGICEVRM